MVFLYLYGFLIPVFFLPLWTPALWCLIALMSHCQSLHRCTMDTKFSYTDVRLWCLYLLQPLDVRTWWRHRTARGWGATVMTWWSAVTLRVSRGNCVVSTASGLEPLDSVLSTTTTISRCLQVDWNKYDHWIRLPLIQKSKSDLIWCNLI